MPKKTTAKQLEEQLANVTAHNEQLARAAADALAALEAAKTNEEALRKEAAALRLTLEKELYANPLEKDKMRIWFHTSSNMYRPVWIRTQADQTTYEMNKDDGERYTVKIMSTGQYECTCSQYRYKRECKHARMLIAARKIFRA